MKNALTIRQKGRTEGIETFKNKFLPRLIKKERRKNYFLSKCTNKNGEKKEKKKGSCPKCLANLLYVRKKTGREKGSMLRLVRNPCEKRGGGEGKTRPQ